MEIKRKVAETKFSKQVGEVGGTEENKKVEVKGVPFWERGWFTYLVLMVPVLGMMCAKKGGHKKMFIMSTIWTLYIPAMILGMLALGTDNKEIIGDFGLGVGLVGGAVAAYKTGYKKTAIALAIFGSLGLFQGITGFMSFNDKQAVQESIGRQQATAQVQQEIRSEFSEKVTQEQSVSAPKVTKILDNSEISSVVASSELRGKDGNVFYAGKLFDGNEQTAWAEGVKGYGEGESIIVKFKGHVSLRAIDIWNGYQKDELVFANNSMPQDIQIITNDKYRYNVTHHLQKIGGVQHIVLSDHAIYTDQVQLVINSVYKGRLWKDTSITEIKFWVDE